MDTKFTYGAVHGSNRSAGAGGGNGEVDLVEPTQSHERRRSATGPKITIPGTIGRGVHNGGGELGHIHVCEAGSRDAGIRSRSGNTGRVLARVPIEVISGRSVHST